MDPIANLREQRELAAAIIVDDFDDAAPGKRTPAMVELLARVDRLAELVYELDQWRERGGFDPYEPKLDAQHRALIRFIQEYKPPRVDLNYAPFSLPDGYIEFVISSPTSDALVGGIDPEGRVST